MIWYDMVWYDMIWYDMIWYEMVWYDMKWCDTIWYDMLRCGIWYAMLWYDMVWYDMNFVSNVLTQGRPSQRSNRRLFLARHIRNWTPKIRTHRTRVPCRSTWMCYCWKMLSKTAPYQVRYTVMGTRYIPWDLASWCESQGLPRWCGAPCGASRTWGHSGGGHGRAARRPEPHRTRGRPSLKHYKNEKH